MAKKPATLINDKGQPALVREADGAILRWVNDKRNPSLGQKMRNVTAEPLDVYLHRGAISRDQFNTGDRLRRLHYAAHGSGYASVNYGGVHGGADHSKNWRFSAKQAYAMREISDLLGCLPRDLRYVVERVVFWSENANRPAQAIGVSARRGIGMLREALNKIGQAEAGATSVPVSAGHTECGS